MDRLEQLSDQLNAWCDEQGLPYESADELILRDELLPKQRKWLSDFILKWNATASPVVPIPRDEVLEMIANQHLQIRTLETRNSDRLDFHEVGVAGLKDALNAAYEAGLDAARKQAVLEFADRG